jgi:hypothetical protein
LKGRYKDLSRANILLLLGNKHGDKNKQKGLVTAEEELSAEEEKWVAELR